MNLFAISGLLIGILSSVLGVLVFVKGRTWVHYVWVFFCFSVALWGFGAYKIATVLEAKEAVLWWRIAYIGVIFIPILFTHFVYKFLGLSRKWLLKVIYSLGFLFLVINFINGLFIDKVRFVFAQFYYISPPTILYNLFVIFFFGLIIYSHIRLLQGYKIASGVVKSQIKYIFLATIIGFSGGAFAFLPVYKIDVYPVLNITIAFAPMVVAYAIVKKELFDIKVVLTSFFVGLITLLFTLDIFIFTPDLLFKLYKALILVVFFYFGYLLIKSVLKEIEYREEIAKAYEMEKAAKEEVEKLTEAKTQFIMATQHHLRTPLTSIIGYLDLLFGGTYGKVPPKIKETLLKFQVSTKRLIRVVNALLDISQFQMGKRVVALEPGIDFESLIKEVMEELSFEVKIRGLYLKYEKIGQVSAIKADSEKLKVALFNIIDNAIKYTKQGGITVNLKQAGKLVQLSVKDTGIGVDPKQAKKLFKEAFARGDEAKKVHGFGRGIGVYITGHIIRAHHGKIWAESEGKDKGSTFFVELPID